MNLKTRIPEYHVRIWAEPSVNFGMYLGVHSGPLLFTITAETAQVRTGILLSLGA